MHRSGGGGQRCSSDGGKWLSEWNDGGGSMCLTQWEGRKGRGHHLQPVQRACPRQERKSMHALGRRTHCVHQQKVVAHGAGQIMAHGAGRC